MSTTTTTRRDLHREHLWLENAARGHTAFVEHAEARLAAGDEPYGDSWMWIGLRRHVAELLEEAADLGAWSALARQVVDRETTLDDVHRQQIGAPLELTARHGAAAHEALTRAAQLLDSRKGDDKWERASW